MVCDLLLDGRFPGGLAGATLGGTAGAFLGGALLAILSGHPAGRPGVVAAVAALVGASLMLLLVKMADVAGGRPAGRRLLSEGDVLPAHRQRDGRPDV